MPATISRTLAPVADRDVPVLFMPYQSMERSLRKARFDLMGYCNGAVPQSG